MSTIAERGRAHIFLGDRFFVYDNMAMSTGVEAIRGAIRESTLASHTPTHTGGDTMDNTKAIDPEDRRRRSTDTVAILTEEGWGVQYTEEGIVLRRGGARVLITDDGAVISSDPIARLHVHCIYYPEIYGVATETPSR